MQCISLNAKPRENGGDPSCSACWLSVDERVICTLMICCCLSRPGYVLYQSQHGWSVSAKPWVQRRHSSANVVSSPDHRSTSKGAKRGVARATKFDQFILHTFRRHDNTQGPNQIRRSPASDAVQPQSVCTPSIGPTTTNCQMYQVGDQVAACRRGAGPSTPNIRPALRREPRYHLVGNDYRCKSLINSKPTP